MLRSLHRFEEDAIRDALTKLLGLPGVSVEDASGVAGALELNAAGIEFADALHLASRPAGAFFASFNRTFIKRATRAGAPRVRSAYATAAGS